MRLGEGIGLAGDVANEQFAAPGTDLFLTDERDERGMADPLSRILIRRLPVVGQVANPDVADALAAALTLGLYLVKQGRLWLAYRRQVRDAAEAARTQDVVEPV